MWPCFFLYQNKMTDHALTLSHIRDCLWNENKLVWFAEHAIKMNGDF